MKGSTFLFKHKKGQTGMLLRFMLNYVMRFTKEYKLEMNVSQDELKTLDYVNAVSSL